MMYEVKKNEHGHDVVAPPAEDWMRWAGVPERMVSARWCISRPAMLGGCGELRAITDESLRDDFEWLSQWSKLDAERVVVIHGPQGRGKSTYAAATLRRALSAKPRPLWTDWPALVSAVTDSWSNYQTSESEIIGRFVRAGFLVVDDFGKELTRGSGKSEMRDWQIRIAFALINGRYNKRLPTVITTELDAAGMSARLDRAITSRLMHEGYWIDLSRQPDHRIER
jgi:DNA replication protein DnaC